jgi:hypothetical protein
MEFNLRQSYNHPVWPSPRARIVAKRLGYDQKRMTHEQALKWLASKTFKSVPDFLQMDQESVWVYLGFYRYSYGKIVAYDPLYPQKRNRW